MTDIGCVIQSSLVAARKQATAFAEGTMTTTVTVSRRSGLGALDYATGLVTDPDTTIYTGKARIGRLQGTTQLILGDEQEYFASVQVSIPLTAPQVVIDDIVEITSGPDPYVIGRTFRVTDTGGGGDLPTSQTFTALGVSRSRVTS